METRMIYLPSGEVFENRKQTKQFLGHGAFNRALKLK